MEGPLTTPRVRGGNTCDSWNPIHRRGPGRTTSQELRPSVDELTPEGGRHPISTLACSFSPPLFLPAHPLLTFCIGRTQPEVQGQESSLSWTALLKLEQVSIVFRAIKTITIPNTRVSDSDYLSWYFRNSHKITAVPEADPKSIR